MRTKYEPIVTSINFGPATIEHRVYGAGESYEAHYYEVQAGDQEEIITKQDAINAIRFMMEAFGITQDAIR